MNKDTRTDEQLNAVIATWRGWKFQPETPSGAPFDYEPEHWLDADGGPVNWFFCEDLGAIHEAVSNLPDGPYTWWTNHLMQIVGTHLKCINAGPRERAEALVALIESGIPLS